MPAFLFVAAFVGFLPATLGFVAGAMVWMIACELLPDALEHASRRAVVSTALVSFGAMLGFQAILL